MLLLGSSRIRNEKQKVYLRNYDDINFYFFAANRHLCGSSEIHYQTKQFLHDTLDAVFGLVEMNKEKEKKNMGENRINVNVIIIKLIIKILRFQQLVRYSMKW